MLVGFLSSINSTRFRSNIVGNLARRNGFDTLTMSGWVMLFPLALSLSKGFSGNRELNEVLTIHQLRMQQKALPFRPPGQQ